jgi:hypothetical protein
MAEPTIEQKIKSARLIWKTLMCAAVVVVLLGSWTHFALGSPYATSIEGGGLIFAALGLVGIYTEMTLKKQIEAGKTFFGAK